ncbi:DinB family protein [Dyadobacter sandarakinus]|uniref:DinB family protein n=1 Tax=Dyadobacter sandarakinus TaxID=2747268 RepID=A0ABX7I1E2_9BACT|nr:DinB family protein [Dyadobacter sandarakinus]QRQ99677.1 DinB family protein [Dyadobacter sandarakinus]
METSQQSSLMKELEDLITKGNAHVTFEDAVAGLPPAMRTMVPENLPYSIWQLVEHVRIAQKDILEFSSSEDYEALDWPDDYWTPAVENVSDSAWEQSLAEIRSDRNRFLELVKNEKHDLYAAIPWGNGQNLLREAMLIADHNAYHTAEIVVIRRLLKCWK